MKRVRLALLGCGAISEWHLLGLKDVADIEVVATIDVDAARAAATAKASGARAFSSLDVALRDGDFDAVDIMLPHHLHETAAVRCLAAGKHVLLEKPMAPTLEACERILAAARAAGTVFLVAENAQYWPEVLIAKRALDAGAIGEVVTARAALFFPPMQEFYGAGNWRFEHAASGGGVSIDTGSHYLRPLRMWLGEIEEVVAAMERPYERMQGESLARALLRFRSGVVASFDLLLTPAPVWRGEMFRITGTRGEIVVDARVLLCDESNRRGAPLEPDVPQGYLLSYTGELADFANAILRGTTPVASAEYSLGELRTALAMARSARSKSWERVWD